MTTTVTVLSTGGTIASTDDGDGARPTRTGAELLDGTPELARHARLTVESVARTPSFDMDVPTLLELRTAVQSADRGGADGVVVTHGTDTMEESACFLEMSLDVDLPVVFTGAQRRPDEPGPDGPSNLRTAVRAASHQRVREGGGTYVAFNEELHAARTVTKSHTTKLEAFTSPDGGPVGVFDRGGFRQFRPLGRRCVHLPVEEVEQSVPIVSSAVGMDGRSITDACERGVDGIVVEGTGVGNTTGAIGDAVESAIDSGVPVVLASRCHAGSLHPVYGTGGGGETLRRHGVVTADDLPAQKARLKLVLALEHADDTTGVRRAFDDTATGD
jgi:L-asparaginase